MDFPLYALIPILVATLFLAFVLYIGFSRLNKIERSKESVVVEPLPAYEIRPPPYQMYSLEPPIYVVVE